MRCSLQNGGLLSFGCDSGGLEMRCEKRSVVKNHLPLKCLLFGGLVLLSLTGDSRWLLWLRGSPPGGQRGLCPG